MDFAVFALLPLGLVSLFFRGRSSDAGFGWFAALAPVIGKGLTSLFGAKSKQSEQQKQADYERQQAAAQAAADQRSWEAQQNSPQALAARQNYTMQLGRLAGAMGGLDKVPPSILNYLQTQRKAREYVPGANYVEKPKSGSGWDIASGVADALSYLDYNKLKSGKVPASDAGGIAAGQKIPQPTGISSTGTPQYEDYLSRLKKYGMGGDTWET